MLSKKNIQYKLLYRASRDGDSSYTFHSKCDQKVNVLFVIQTIKGLKFGGYTEKTWEVTGSAKRDNNLFVFSLDYLKKYNCIKGKENMNPDKERGPRIGNWIIWVGQKFMANPGETCSKESALNYFEGLSKDYEINNGEKKFNINEFEAFQIIMT